MRDKYIVGNWKMNQTLKDIEIFFSNLKDFSLPSNTHAWIAPQFIHLQKCKELGSNKNIKIGAQNCANQTKGAFTGEVSPISLKDFGTEFVIVGHSERRSIYEEDHAVINQKVKLLQESGTTAIFCLGETVDEKDQRRTLAVLEEQLTEGLRDCSQDNLIIAYEPVWAIGTGKTATPEMANDAHKFIREFAAEKFGFESEKLIILYGGSVKPNNIKELIAMEHIDGGLVGGASLKAEDFIALCQ